MGQGLSQINIYRTDIYYLVADIGVAVAAKMTCWFRAALIACGALISISPAMAQSRLAEFATRATPQEFFSKATRFGAAQGDPPLLPVYAGDALLGFVYLNSDFTGAVAIPASRCAYWSVSMRKGRSPRFKLVDHKEPIVLVGIPEKRVVEAVNTLIGAGWGASRGHGTRPAGRHRQRRNRHRSGDGRQHRPLRRPLIKSGRMSPGGTAAASGAPEARDEVPRHGAGGKARLAKPGRRRLRPPAEPDRRRRQQGIRKIRQQRGCRDIPKPGDPDDTFIDLYVALASAPVIGRSLLGDDGYEQLRRA